MKITTFCRISCIHCICLFFLSLTAPAQNVLCDAETLEDFYACYGGQSAFSAHSVKAINTFIQADSALVAGNYAQAKTLLDNLFNTYPKGSNIWWNVFNDPNGANIGTPHAYYGLRMMEDIIDYGMNGTPGIPVKKVNMKIVLVGCSEGIQPTTDIELQNGTGTFVTHSIDTALKESDYRIVKQSFDLFSRYVTAITGGELEVAVEFIELDNLCLPVSVSSTPPYLAYNNIAPVWDNLTQEAKDSTDWWWILYPSHVPEFPDFDDDSFITGGMGSDSKGGPVFIIDDKWLVRKPAHLGKGLYSDIERRIYLPQWLQHEFFHHLYRIYPELELEVNGHDWFNLAFWPPDFEGRFEADYYAETLHKRLQIDCAPLSAKLITRVPDNQEVLFNTFSMDELLGGPYSLDVIQNAWHTGSIIQENGQYFWKNAANVKWKVTPNFAEGRLETGSDSPYPGQDFFIELYRTTEGNLIPGAVALKYQGELYKKRFDLIRESVPVEIALGPYERVNKLTPQHTGNIVKSTGMFYWQTDAGDNWLLTPNAANEYLSLNPDSPTPGEKFQLILAETECDIYALGFKYLNHYYWKPKRSAANDAPVVVSGIPDLELPENFGSHSINFSGVFADPESDSLQFFVTSEDPALIAAGINSQQLTLSGNTPGSTTIFLMAVDANGGLAVDAFNVKVTPAVSTLEAISGVRVFPNLTHDFVQITGADGNYDISLVSMDKTYQQNIPVTGNNMRVDLRPLPPGTYLLLLKDSSSGNVRVEKIVRY